MSCIYVHVKILCTLLTHCHMVMRMDIMLVTHGLEYIYVYIANVIDGDCSIYRDGNEYCNIIIMHVQLELLGCNRLK